MRPCGTYFWLNCCACATGPVGGTGDDATSVIIWFSANVALLPGSFQARQLVTRLPVRSGIPLGR